MLKKMGNNNLVRLQKFMAECGVASRRKSEELIEMGKVKVNGHVAHIGDKINPKKDIVAVRGKKITKEERMYYIMLNKPRGYVTTVSDELGRKTVMDLVDCDARVYPVGRLDKDSEGLLILTNDGSFANALTHPKHNYAKVYRVTVRPSVNDEMLEKMRNGIEIDGRKTAPCDINIISKVRAFQDAFLTYLRANHQKDVLDVLASGKITDEITSLIEKVAADAAGQFKA